MKQDILAQLQNVLTNETDFNVKMKKVNEIKKEWESLAIKENAEDSKNPEEESLDNEINAILTNFEVEVKKYEDEKKQNDEKTLEKKRNILQQLKELEQKPEENNSFKKLKEIQEQWKSAGKVHAEGIKELQVEYNFLVEKIYHDLQLNREFRELDYKKNSEAKRGIIAKIENLLNDESINHVALVIKELEYEWKETGPVPYDEKDEINQKYLTSVKSVYSKIDTYFADRRTKEKENLEGKERLIQKVKTINSKTTTTSHRAWVAETDNILFIREEWRKIGFSENDSKLWDAFKTECNIFFERKQEFYNKVEAQRKLAREIKNQLCEKAENTFKEFEENKDFKKANEIFLELQREWAKTPSAAQAVENALWMRFRTQCDSFFSKKDESIKVLQQEQQQNLEQKQALLAEMKAYTLLGEYEKDIETFKNFSKKWQQIGLVPRPDAKTINNDYNETLDNLYNQLKTNRTEAAKLKFAARVENMKSANDGKNALRNERMIIKRKIDQLQNEISTLENNLGFFKGNVSNNPMARQVLDKINKNKSELEVMYSQLNIISS